jgi:acyl-CoA thioesterase-2
MLRLTQVDDNAFEGRCHQGRSGWIYGGHVAAQALVAAGATVQEERPVHSLHAYFLRPGHADEPVTYLVERTRDGRSFSVHQVRAVQQDETIFTLLASFQQLEEGFVHQHAGVEIPPLPDVDPILPSLLPDSPIGRWLDIRLVDRDSPGARQRLWLRLRDRLGDDALTHAAAFTYLSDIYLAGSSVLPHQAGRSFPVTSLDHALWLHRPFRADEWLFAVQHSPVAAGSRGLTVGEFFTPDGVLVASVQQEALIRPPR